MDDVRDLATQRRHGEIVHAQPRPGANISFQNVETRGKPGVAEHSLDAIDRRAIGWTHEHVDTYAIALHQAAEQIAPDRAGGTRQKNRRAFH